MRLNVYLQKAGIGSRREAERMVAEGRVSVNGVKALATTPVEAGDEVCVDGRAVAPETKPLPRLFVLNKPIDVLVTHRDHKGRPTIFDLPSLKPPKWPATMPRVMNIGRLDVNSEGLLLLASDGPLAQAMILTAIVIAMGIAAFVLALTYRSFRLTTAEEVVNDPEDTRVSKLTDEEASSIDEDWGTNIPRPDTDQPDELDALPGHEGSR